MKNKSNYDVTEMLSNKYTKIYNHEQVYTNKPMT